MTIPLGQERRLWRADTIRELADVDQGVDVRRQRFSQA